MGWLDNLSDETRMELERHSKVAAIASLAPSFISYAAKLDAEAAAFDIEARARGYVPEKTCRAEHAKHGPLFDVLRFSCCGYEWAENRTDPGATEPDPNFCPNCGARVIE